MAPDVELSRRDVQVAADDQWVSGIPSRHVGGQTREEVQLVRELGVDPRIGLIPTGRRVEIVDIDAGDARRNASCMAFAADVERPYSFKRQAGRNGDPMPALLADNLQVGIPRLGESVGWEGGRLALDFLQAQDVRPLLLGEPEHLVESQANRVYIPGRDS
jgi:hypothetical protein